MKTRILSAIAASVMASAASAQVQIYAVNNLATGSNTLTVFQSNNPAGWSTVGATGIAGAGFTGLDFDATGSLFGYVGYNATGTGANNGLYSINPGTGVATPIGAPGANNVGLNDLAYNPATGNMYGILGSSLYSVNLATGAQTLVGPINGLPATGSLEVGLAFSSTGAMFVHDISTDRIFSGTLGSVSQLYQIPVDTNFSQGMTIDWSRNDQGYHAALGPVGTSYYSDLYTFTTSGSSYSLAGSFSPSGSFPTFEGGDLAIRPIPAPGSLALLGLGGLLAARRRR